MPAHEHRPVRYRGAAALGALTLSIGCQIAAFGANIALRQLFLNRHLSQDVLTQDRDWLIVTVAVHSAVAYLCARFVRLPTAWRIANLLVAPLTVISIELALPSWMILAALVLLLLVYLPTFWTHVPYYPTEDVLYRALLERLPNDSSLHFVDLGCGFGRLLAFLAKERPAGKFVGVELGPLPLIIAKLRARLPRRKNLTIRARNIWKEPCGAYSVVYAFLSPEPMELLWKKLKGEMRSGALFISNSFPIPGVTPEEVLQLGSKQQLYLYRI